MAMDGATNVVGRSENGMDEGRMNGGPINRGVGVIFARLCWESEIVGNFLKPHIEEYGRIQKGGSLDAIPKCNGPATTRFSAAIKERR
jgi:hypothetical protein